MRVLTVAAHPDDEVLGCGGTLALLSEKGAEVHILILGEGVTSRDRKRDPEARRKEIETLRKAAERAAEILKAGAIYFESLPDNRFDALNFLDLVKLVEEYLGRILPQTIFTHFPGDLNLDHVLTARAVLTAARPLPGSPVRRIYAFEVPSSTEWNFTESFRPNAYFDISDTLSRKLEALKCYRQELRDFPHPRSPEGVKILARRRGMETGVSAAEAFVLLRALERPASILFASQLPEKKGEHLELALSWIKEHEGLRLKPYRDTVGKLTIGYGRNLEDVGLSPEEAEVLLRNDLLRCEAELREALGGTYEALSPVRKAVLLDMIYNLGKPRFLGFKRMIAALKAGDFSRAAGEMLDSRWAAQVGRRAQFLAEKMREG